MPVGQIDDVQIGDGQTGAITATLRAAYLDIARAEFPSLDK
jgi:branched-subunit amino acid aminotransferase/4-amino-4-deoxychorismate lyase